MTKPKGMLPQEDLEHILTNTGSAIHDLKGKSIFLTGGTGFFGKWLLESFLYMNKKLSLNSTVTVLSRNPDAFLNKFSFYKDETSVRFLKGDILSFEFPSHNYDYIIHAATEADATLNSSQPLLMLDTITAGTRRMLDFATQQPVKSFLFTSSGAVYGKQPAEVTHIKETDSFVVDINNPTSAYAEGKRLAELYCSIYNKHYHVPVKIARCFAFVGPYLPLDKHFAIGNFILNTINRDDIVIKGDGTPYRSYLYAADLTGWLWTILLKGKDLTPYNVGSDEDYDLKSVAQTVAKLSPGLTVAIISKADPMKPVERYVPDISLIKSELGCKVTFNLEQSILKTKKFYAGA